jgi:hypothetical protein
MPIHRSYARPNVSAQSVAANERPLHVWCKSCTEVTAIPAFKWNWSFNRICKTCNGPLEQIPPRAKGNWVYLGYRTYRDYLQSDLWKSIRDKVLAKYRHRCIKCGGQASQVHHRSYHIDVLMGHDIRSLVPMCRNCHEGIEFGRDGSKLNIGDANRELKAQLLPKWNALQQKKKSQKKGRRKPNCLRFKNLRKY